MIYISGLIGGSTLEGIKAKFQEAEDHLHALGLKIVNPMKLGFTGNWTSKEMLEKRLDVIRESATAIFLLYDWKNDINAKREFAEVASINLHRAHKIRIYFEESGGYRDIAEDVKDKTITCIQLES